MACFYFNRSQRMAGKEKRIRILYTIPNFDTAGSGKALLNIALRLDSSQFEPHIMCMHGRGEFFKVVKESGIPVHLHEYTTQMKPYWKGLMSCWEISRALKKIAPDIIHSFHYSSDYSEAIAARLAGIKWVYTKKNMSWGGSSKNAWRLRTWLASGIIAQNTDMLKQFFPSSNKVTLIPRGVNVAQFAAGSLDQALRSQYGVENSERIIICVANLVPVKGVEVLIDAFAGLAMDFPQWKVWLVGDDKNEYGEILKQKVRKLRLSRRIIFTGKQPNVKPFLDQAEIFVLPTLNQGRMEGSPVALLEAMANGKVVLGSNVPGIRDQLRDFSALIFEASNSRELSGMLKNLIQKSVTEFNELTQSILNSCRIEYTIEEEIQKHLKFYLLVLNK